jgi:hypothetical protein
LLVVSEEGEDVAWMIRISYKREELLALQETGKKENSKPLKSMRSLLVV